MSSMFDKVLAYQFIKKLTTPFIHWPAFSMRLIDANGNFLKDKSRFTPQEANAMGYFDILILNIKKILAKIPGGASRLGTIAATMFLLRTPVIKESLITEEEIEIEFLKVFESLKAMYEDGAVAVNAAGNTGADGNPTVAGIGPASNAKGMPGVRKGPMDRYKDANRRSEGPILANIQRRLREGEEVGVVTPYDDGGPEYQDKNSKIAKKVHKGYLTFIKKAKGPLKEDLHDVVDSFPGKSSFSSSQNVMVQNPVTKTKKKLTVDEASTLQYHKELNPKLWEDDGVLNSEVRNKLIEIATTWVSFAKIPPGSIQDIIITGGNVNYNYTPNSDIDLHIVISRSELNPDREFVDEYLQDKKILWTLQHENISIYGYPVELYAQDVADVPHLNQGVYSITLNQWLARPQLLDLDFANDYHLQKKVEFYQDMIDKMISNNVSDESIDILKDKFKKMRSDSIAKNGEFALGNLVFKELRNSGYIDKLNIYKKERLDKSLSLESI